jgi:molybdopterin molybdotransferase
MINYKKSLSILNKNRIIINSEEVPSKDSINRICSKNVYSKVNYPAANNSAFDGFAIKSSDSKFASKRKKIKFQVLKILAAGDKPKIKYKKNSCIEIMTGAIIPKPFDTIIPVEIAKIEKVKKNRFLFLESRIKKNQHVRYYGSDFKKKQIVISKGEIINSSHILALKTLGVKNILVKKKPNILFFSTGNEISENNNVSDWMVRNSNSYYLRSLAKNFLFNYYDGGLIRDNDEKKFYNILKKKLKSKFDIIITSGAVSAGKFDFIPKIIKKFKTKGYFKGISIRPGKPLLFAKFRSSNKSFFGLPGNPISSAACFRFFVYPYLLKILDTQNEKPFNAILKKNFTKKKFFTRFVKAKLTMGKNNKLEIEILKGQESFRIKSFINSNSWAVLKDGKSNFKKGQIIECYNSEITNKFFFK